MGLQVWNVVYPLEVEVPPGVTDHAVQKYIRDGSLFQCPREDMDDPLGIYVVEGCPEPIVELVVVPSMDPVPPSPIAVLLGEFLGEVENRIEQNNGMWEQWHPQEDAVEAVKHSASTRFFPVAPATMGMYTAGCTLLGRAPVTPKGWWDAMMAL
jgi:hypothetical protein